LYIYNIVVWLNNLILVVVIMVFGVRGPETCAARVGTLVLVGMIDAGASVTGFTAQGTHANL
jgi:hypothetical protein